MGIGDWGLGPIPNPQSPIPNPQSPIIIFLILLMKKLLYCFNLINYNNTNIYYLLYQVFYNQS